MQKRVAIEFNWWNEATNEESIAEHHEALEESAWARIGEMMDDGYTSGELVDNVRMPEADGEGGVSYRVSWSAESIDLDYLLQSAASASAEELSDAMGRLSRSLSPEQLSTFSRALVDSGLAVEMARVARETRRNAEDSESPSP